MHREIEFRGKRVANSDWLRGFYFSYTDLYEKHFIVTTPCYYDYLLINTFEVDPATVGQYTGLKDKNGVEIYEGDVVCNRWGNYYTPIFRNGIYMAYNIEWSHWMQQEPSTQFNVIWKEGCEVIGNIHDNPELLEVE